jgi:CRISPR-associated endonuclease/helicase Cas3
MSTLQRATMNFDAFFKAATGHEQGPFDYQRRLAVGDAGCECQSRLINIPTGLGKTAGVVLAWLWNRVAPSLNSQPSTLTSPPWPRRLVYCLPMRTLVEQTEREVAKWLTNLHAKADEVGFDQSVKAELDWLMQHSPVILMGGEELNSEKRDWDIHPEKPCILIGTQDMLLSRALNRGYGMSRYRWPMHFGLLNNDCLWVMDETQLMGVGVETTAQLDAFRTRPETVVNGCQTWWMSATLDASRLATVDHSEPVGGWPRLTLDKADLALPDVSARFEAKKPLGQAPVSLTAESKKDYAAQVAQFIASQHQPGSLTLVVFNNVARAQDVHRELKQLNRREPLALIHSRFRPSDRQGHEAVLYAKGGRIVIATQAVEAGVDVSARTLITELAPWSSVVQRFGRCNRRGEFRGEEARVFWLDISPQDEGDDIALPYTRGELKAARNLLSNLRDVGPQSLKDLSVEEPRVIRPVLRRKDLVELFDTTPDLAGHDLDIARYVRDGADNDVQVFWRALDGQAPGPEEPEPIRDELCRVSLGRFREFLSKLNRAEAKAGTAKLRAYAWNQLADEWQPASAARAGAIYLLDVRVGGYSTELGWFGTAKFEADVAPRTLSEKTPAPGYDGNESSFHRNWVTLLDHTRHVVDETSALAAQLAPDLAPVFTTAACWHDVGKAHAAFQRMLTQGDTQRAGELWGKSANVGGRCERPFFRHELASALAWLQTAPAGALERDLAAYLIAAHHGKVRLSLRSLPGEEAPPDRPDARLARGVLEGDPLGPLALDGVCLPAITLDLSLMEMGWDSEREPTRGPSWLGRMIALRDRFGPFRLAWLETLLRVADARASAEETQRNGRLSAGVSPNMELREEPPAYTTTEALSTAEQTLVADLVTDGLSIQEKFRPEPLYKRTGKGHYASDTVEEIRQAKKSKRKEDKS